jgi:hypothetical protein
VLHPIEIRSGLPTAVDRPPIVTLGVVDLAKVLVRQRVLERVGRLGRKSALHHQLCVYELRQHRLEGCRVQGHDSLHHLIGKRAPNRGPQLRHDFDGSEAIQPCQEGIMQGGGNRQGWQRAMQCIMVLLLLQQTGLQHRLGQLFHKQGHAIHLAHYLLEHSRG